MIVELGRQILEDLFPGGAGGSGHSASDASGVYARRWPCTIVEVANPVTEQSEGRDPLAEVVALLEDTAVEVAGRTIRLTEPVRGDPGAAALRVLGIAQAASPVGTAAHGATGVAAGVWQAPNLYLARWTANRWVVGYRLAGGARPNDYIRTEGRIPGRLETGNWYATVPDEVREAFVDVGLSLDLPPFPVPEQPEPAKPAARSSRQPAPGRGAPEKAPGAPPRRPAARKPPAQPKPAQPKPVRPTAELATKVCPGCNMRKTLTQFDAGSELCVDCR